MIQTKIFTETDSDDLQRKVNQWIEKSNSNIVIQNTHYQTSALSIGPGTVVFSLLIEYEIK